MNIPELDSTGYEVLDTLTFVPDDRGFTTLSRPLKFVGYDGKTYWAKPTSQHGLTTELIGGRLAAKVGAGPAARIMHINEASLPPIGQFPQGKKPDDYLGVVVGVEDVPGTENVRDLVGIMQPDDLRARADPGSRALVIAFQSWLGVGDQQMLLRLEDGQCFSIDYGECFSHVIPIRTPEVVVVPELSMSGGCDLEWTHLDYSLCRIEDLTDDEIHESIDRIPQGSRWNADHKWRREIFDWLIARRETLRGVLDTWANERQ